MGKIELVMPKMGESVAEATIIKWLKDEGENIEAEESILEIATDKVDSEIPAPEDGVLVEKLYNEGDVVKVGEPIAIIESESAGDAPAPSKPTPETKQEESPNGQPSAAASAPKQPATAATVTETTTITKRSESGRFYSPLVRSIASKEGISMQELESVEGSGQEGRVTKKDILAYIEQRGEGVSVQTTQSSTTEQKPQQQVKAPASKPAAGSSPSSRAGGRGR